MGQVVSLSDGIVCIHGLENVQYGERIQFDETTYGIALNLERDSVSAVVLGASEHLKEGDIIQVPVGSSLLGRVVDSLGRPIDGAGEINTTEFSPIEKVAPGVFQRRNKKNKKKK